MPQRRILKGVGDLMSTGTFLVMLLDAEGCIPDPIELGFNAEVVSAENAEEAARSSKLTKVPAEVGSVVSVRVVTLSSQPWDFRVADFRVQRLPAPIEFVRVNSWDQEG